MSEPTEPTEPEQAEQAAPQPPKRLGATGLLKWNLWLVAVLLGLEGLAAVAGTLVAAFSSLGDWYMHMVMHGILLIFVLLYVQAHHRRRRVSRAFLTVLNVLLGAFFVIILIDRAAPVRDFLDGRVQWRPAIPLLWVPAILIGLSALVLLVHWLFVAGKLPAWTGLPERTEERRAERAR